MRILSIILLSLISFMIYAATLDDDGNLVLSRDEVQQTIASWNLMNEEIVNKNLRIQQLEKELEYVIANKCL
jgi:hypothetical protein|tara:strand:+ start:255 stop:470 length:216 start_codon:yes stop_codon:yes gene_type:complete